MSSFDRLKGAAPEPTADDAALAASAPNTGQLEIGKVRLTELSLTPPRRVASFVPWLVVVVLVLALGLVVGFGLLPAQQRLAEIQVELDASRNSLTQLRAQLETLQAKSADLEQARSHLTNEVEQKASEHDQLVRTVEEKAAQDRRKVVTAPPKKKKKKK